jgi:DNA-directed RNA polymerase specialized sigma subunit
MTNQEKKKILLEYISNVKSLDSLFDEKARWKARAEKITPTYSDMPSSSMQSDKIQTAVEEIEKIEQKIEVQIQELSEKRDNVLNYIYSVNEQKLRLILKYVYIDGLSLNEVQFKMRYSYKQICRIHGYALSAVKICCP